IFVADTDHGKAPSGPGGGPKIEASWQENNLVEIERDQRSRVFKEETEYDGITITYKEISEPGV
ncbi:MAG: hypothetical protein KKA70_10955, partial [Proteobacteria bacterium]|nr:hypothetical protein [Pseudomonadota bacterium]